MEVYADYAPLNNFVRCLKRPTHDDQPFDYYEECEEHLELLSNSIDNNLLVLRLEEKTLYLKEIKYTLTNLLKASISITDINIYLIQFDITYGALFRNESNVLWKILNGNPYYTDQLNYDYKSIQKDFYNFWNQLFIKKALEKVATVESKNVEPTAKYEKGKLSRTEKLLLIRLLQDAGLFPEERQQTTKKAICEIISALTGISTGDEVKKLLNKSLGPLFANSLTQSQIREKINNINNIRPLIESLENENLTAKFKSLENKIKGIKI